MPRGHVLRYVIGAPLLVWLLLAWVLRSRSAPGRSRLEALLLGGILLGLLAWNPNFPLKVPWSSGEAVLPWAALLWAGATLLPGRLALAALLLPAGFISWLFFTEVAEYYGWSRMQMGGWILISSIAAAASAWLTRRVARQHPASAALGASVVIALGASLVLLLGRTAKGAEFGATLAALLGIPLLISMRGARERDASSWAVPFAGAVHAVLLFGLLQAEALWISVVLLVVLAPAAGLIQLRDQRPLPRALAVAFVTALPVAAAIFLAWFKAEAAPSTGAYPY